MTKSKHVITENTVESQINVSQIKDKSQIKDILCADQIFTT